MKYFPKLLYLYYIADKHKTLGLVFPNKEYAEKVKDYLFNLTEPNRNKTTGSAIIVEITITQTDNKNGNFTTQMNIKIMKV